MRQMKLWVMGKMDVMKRKAFASLLHREQGIDGILVTIGLCVIALVLCVVMKDALKSFVTTLVDDMMRQAQGILSGTI